MITIRKKPPVFLILLLLNMVWVVSACSVNNAPVTHHGINQRGHTTPLNARGTVTNAHYTVKRGDTLHSIARTNNVPLRDLISANNVSPPYTLRVGQRLTLPVPRSYQVARGDTLYSISRRFQVDMNTLARTNNLRAPYTLRVSQRLQIPDSRTLQQPTTTAVAQRTTPTAAPPPRANTPPPTPPPRSSGKFAWPVQGQVILGFGDTGKGQRNDGINIAAAQGTPVIASDNGVVAYADDKLRGFGNLILIKHSSGWITAYAHNNTLLVKRGDTVKRGQQIATVGSTGNVSQPQLHFETRLNNTPVDPMLHLEPLRLSGL